MKPIDAYNILQIYLISENGKRNNEISKIIFGEISKTYCNTISNIRCGKSHNDFMKFVINNNYKPSTTISQESTQ